MDLKLVRIEKLDDTNVILGQAHFIKTIEDLYEAIVQTVPGMRFGVAFCEASGPCLVRYVGNDPALVEIARKNALAVGAGHSFFIFLEGGFPVNILNAVKSVPEVCHVFCATSNPTDVVVAETAEGRAILGVADGFRPRGVETDADIAKRKQFLRAIGYKL